MPTSTNRRQARPRPSIIDLRNSLTPFSAISHTAHGRCRLPAPNPTVHAGGMYEDEISRVAFAEPDMVRYLLALLPADVVEGLDTRRLRRFPAEQIGRGARRRMADMTWAVGAPTPEDPDAEVLLVVEFQAAPHRHMALRMDAYVALLRQEMADDLPAGTGLPPALPVLVYTGDRPWQPASLRQLTAPALTALRRWQPDLELLSLDATTLSAEDGEVNPVAALLRLQRCRQQAALPDLAAALFGALRRDGLLALAERLSDVLMRSWQHDSAGTNRAWLTQRNCGAHCAAWRNRRCWRKQSHNGTRRRSPRAGGWASRRACPTNGRCCAAKPWGGSASRRAMRSRRSWRTRRMSNGSPKLAIWWSNARARRSCCVAAAGCSTVGLTPYRPDRGFYGRT